jgi:hypothetical protein
MKGAMGEDANFIWDTMVNNLKAGLPDFVIEELGGKPLKPMLNMWGKEIAYYPLFQDEAQLGAMAGDIHPTIVKFVDKFNNEARGLLQDRTNLENFRLTRPKRVISNSTSLGSLMKENDTYEMNNDQYYNYLRLCAGKDGNTIGGKDFETTVVEMIRKNFPDIPANLRNSETMFNRIKMVQENFRQKALMMMKIRDPDIKHWMTQGKIKRIKDEIDPSRKVDLNL